MTYRFISCLMTAFFVTSSFLCSTVAADTRPNGLTITPFAGGYVFEGNEPYKGGALYGLALGYRFSDHWSTELSMSYGDFENNTCDESNPNGEDQFIGGYGVYLDVAYDIFPQNKLVPYLTVGMGAIALDDDNDNDEKNYGIDNKNESVFHYGAGVRYALSDQIDIRADVRHALTFDKADRRGNDYDLFNNLMTTVGFTYTFGKSKPAVQQFSSTDQDQDGVPDSIDQCPGTLPGISVNSFGCSKDSDSDGVMDGKDKCPNTPANVVVGSDGCPLDADRDGVNDAQDKCPNTPSGTFVDATGCKAAAQEDIRLNLKIEFESGKAEVESSSLNKIKEVAEIMEKYPNSAAVIEAHTDSSGAAEYNLELSQKRAAMVVDYLSNFFGVDRSRLAAVGYGETRPIADNRTKAGRKQNRRAVAIITATP
ncbi:MAG: OmpA family protein [Candidatus Magnetomorum sp.]|nr:OmpA family protein [Candidatus Magnetomorum sp.]